MWDLIVSVSDYCLSFFFVEGRIFQLGILEKKHTFAQSIL